MKRPKEWMKNEQNILLKTESLGLNLTKHAKAN